MTSYKHVLLGQFTIFLHLQESSLNINMIIGFNKELTKLIYIELRHFWGFRYWREEAIEGINTCAFPIIFRPIQYI